MDDVSPHLFDLSDCIIESYESDTIECPNCGPCLISIVAPDVVFADLNENLIYEDCNIQFARSKSNLLVGIGAFASVYKANVNGTNLAVKVC